MKQSIKWAGLLMALVMLFSMVGCSGKDPAETSSEESAQTPEEKVEGNKKITDDMVTLAQAGEGETKTVTAVIETSMGVVTVALYPEYAPKAVENFIALAQSGYYNGLKFHRVIENYLVQSGDPTGTGSGGQSSYQDAEGNQVGFEIEHTLNLWNFRGALGMTPSADGTNGSQFYIVCNNAVDREIVDKMEAANFPPKVISRYKETGGAPWLDSKQTVFGHITSGIEVIDEIAMAEVDENKKPSEDIIITRISITV